MTTPNINWATQRETWLEELRALAKSFTAIDVLSYEQANTESLAKAANDHIGWIEGHGPNNPPSAENMKNADTAIDQLITQVNDLLTQACAQRATPVSTKASVEVALLERAAREDKKHIEISNRRIDRLRARLTNADASITKWYNEALRLSNEVDQWRTKCERLQGNINRTRYAITLTATAIIGTAAAVAYNRLYKIPTSPCPEPLPLSTTITGQTPQNPVWVVTPTGPETVCQPDPAALSPAIFKPAASAGRAE